MEINISVQCNGGLLPDIILLTRCGYIEVLSLQPMFPPKPSDIFSPEGGYLEGLDAFRFFLKTVAISLTLTIFLVPNKKNGFGQFSYKFFVPVRVGPQDKKWVIQNSCPKVGRSSFGKKGQHFLDSIIRSGL